MIEPVEDVDVRLERRADGPPALVIRMPATGDSAATLTDLVSRLATTIKRSSGLQVERLAIPGGTDTMLDALEQATGLPIREHLRVGLGRHQPAPHHRQMVMTAKAAMAGAGLLFQFGGPEGLSEAISAGAKGDSQALKAFEKTTKTVLGVVDFPE